jgi:MFS superfamily sulfate permease-like transporter
MRQMRGSSMRGVGADLRAGAVVFLVALPLCLGIATASGAPPFAGLVAGIVGGIVVGFASASPLSVAGPAAGLTVITLDGIEALGFRGFLTATLLAGLMQIAMGTLRLGVLAHFVPNAVIRGMLAAIGLILVLKQIPHAFGYDRDFEGDFGFAQFDGRNTFSELVYSLEVVQPGAIVAALAAGLAYLLWRDYARVRLGAALPTALVAVVFGTAAAALLAGGPMALSDAHLVAIPRAREGLASLWVPPELAALLSAKVWMTAGVLAIVASIESLLCVEAIDRLDPQHRPTPTNRELKAQGLGNLFAGALGGLPVTAVIVRSSANLQAGARSRFAAIFHGALLAAAVLLFAGLLNKIPLASLAVVLIVVGAKLTPPSLYREMWAKGWTQFAPFIATVIFILLSDLLTGTLLGLLVGIYFVIRSNYRSALVVSSEGDCRYVRFTQSVSFLNKGRLKQVLEEVPAGGRLILDGTRAHFIDNDILEELRDFQGLARAREIIVELKLPPIAAEALERSRVRG